MIGWAAWIILSMPMLALARRDLANPRGHGFYRLLAYEAMLGMVIASVPGWFLRPEPAAQIATWVLLVGSIALAVHGFIVLKTAGQPDGPVENTTRLVRSGVYRLIRHPFYAAIMLFSWGLFLKQISLACGLLAAAVTLLLAVAARQEERQTLARFGAVYSRYIQETRMFIPFLF